MMKLRPSAYRCNYDYALQYIPIDANDTLKYGISGLSGNQESHCNPIPIPPGD
jgi:hypothetical protein